ncbi:MAG TPA: hypothetical protein VFC30_07430 [Solirubrobacteraceae bacterium]|nr:hypothetical protein [Solirubrobacteraceae bacterium]
MKLRKRYLPVAAVLGAAIAIVPALATGTPAPSEVKLEINENCHLPEWPCWNVKGNNPEDIGQIQPFTIAQGGTISFEDNDSKALTDVLWKSAAPSCTPGVPSTPKTGWSGTCTFANAGEYEFESEGLFNDGTFNYKKYKVIVEKPGGTGTTSTTTTTTTTTPTTTTPTTTTPTTTMPTTTTPTPTTPTATISTQPSGGGVSTATTPGSIETPPPPAGSHPLATLALANAQHGDAVHGTVQIPAADGGARLEVELLAQGASLAKVKRGGSSRVGRLVRSSAPAGTVSFTVSLDARAKSALRHRHKLALTVKIVLTPKHGTAMTLTRSLVLR